MAANWQDHQMVVDIGAEGTYDTTHAYALAVILDGSTYKMWYSGRAGANYRIIYCTSTNGTTWTGHTMVVDKNSEGTYDSIHSYRPTVIKDGATYKMWYTGSNGANNRIIYCTSANGTSWTGHTMVVDKNSLGGADSVGAAFAAVIKDGATYKMWYSGWDNVNYRIIYCTSDNGTTWTGHTIVVNYGAEGTYDTTSAFLPTVIKDGATYKMWYGGQAGAIARIIYCTSDNGTTWTGHTMVVDYNVEQTYDTNSSNYPSVLKDGATYKMWYSGYDGSAWRTLYTVDTSEVVFVSITIINDVLISNIAKINGVAIANIASVNGVNTIGIGGIDEFTKLMLHMNGDQSYSNHAVTTNGNPQLNSTTKKFGASSMQFDGTGDYLSIPDSGDWDVGAGAFAVDFWLYFTSVTGDLGLFGYGPGNDFFAYTRSSDNTINFVLDAGAGGHLARTWAPSTSTWYHVALTREGSNGDFRWFIDGSQLGSSYVDARTITDYTGAYILGANPDANANWLSGYIDEFRFSKGTSRWTSNFTPPTGPYASDTATKLLLHFDGDESNSGHAITFNGDPRMNATTAKFDGAYYFDGTGDYLSIPDSDDWDFGSGDFTIDCWIKFVGGTIAHDIVGQWVNSTNLWKLYMDNSGELTFLLKVSAANKILFYSTSLGLSSGVWHHLAMVRNGTAFDTYVDGISIASTTSSEVMPDFGGTLQVGYVGAYDSHSYIDEVRVSKGIARWTSNFTPPTSPYSDVSISIGDRGVFGGLDTPGILNNIEYITISSPSNSIDFGDLNSTRQGGGAESNGATGRGVFAGGYTGSVFTNDMGYITISSIGNATVFGDLTLGRTGNEGASNGTNDRAVFMGGWSGSLSNVMDYITISSASNATDFGDIATQLRNFSSGTSNGVNNRGVFIGGYDSASTVYTQIDYITITSLSNTFDFGDLLVARGAAAAESNGISDRAVSACGLLAGGVTVSNIMEYITISSTSNATNFGDLSVAVQSLGGSSNKTNDRAVFAGGKDSSAAVNVIGYITISSTSDTTDFGDLLTSGWGNRGASNA